MTTTTTTDHHHPGLTEEWRGYITLSFDNHRHGARGWHSWEKVAAALQAAAAAAFGNEACVTIPLDDMGRIAEAGPTVQVGPKRHHQSIGVIVHYHEDDDPPDEWYWENALRGASELPNKLWNGDVRWEAVHGLYEHPLQIEEEDEDLL